MILHSNITRTLAIALKPQIWVLCLCLLFHRRAEWLQHPPGISMSGGGGLSEDDPWGAARPGPQEHPGPGPPPAVWRLHVHVPEPHHEPVQVEPLGQETPRQTGELQSRALSLCPHHLLNACPCLLRLLCPKWREYKREKEKAYLHCVFVEVLFFLFSLCGEQQNKLILTSVASLCLVAEWWGTAVNGDTRSPLNIILFLWRGRGEREGDGMLASADQPCETKTSHVNGRTEATSFT